VFAQGFDIGLDVHAAVERLVQLDVGPPKHRNQIHVTTSRRQGKMTSGREQGGNIQDERDGREGFGRRRDYAQLVDSGALVHFAEWVASDERQSTMQKNFNPVASNNDEGRRRIHVYFTAGQIQSSWFYAAHRRASVAADGDDGLPVD
jgi:hypothetical protein